MSHPSFIFFGTPDVASKTLEILKSHGYLPKLIVTAPDKPVGRHFTITPPPAKVWAEQNNVPVMQPEKLTPDIVAELDADIFIVVAYGSIMPQTLIDKAKLGTYNVHYSLLPRWRGATPVEAAILAGDAETGVSIQRMVFKLDAGPVVAEERIAIDPNETALELRARLIPMGAELLAKLLPLLGGVASGREGTEQDESLVTHRGKTKKEDGLVDPYKDDPQELWNKYRAFYGWPGLYFYNPHPDPLPKGEGAAPQRMKITKARFEKGRFIIEKVIPEGKKEQSWN